jgi:tetratricopeptide (TPR) repeat protein
MEQLKAGFLAEPILVGRQHEVEELKSYLDLAIKGEGNTVFISGEAGSGKTRLATEFLNIARRKGVTVLQGWCLSNAAVPYFPFVEAFNYYVSEDGENSRQLSLKKALRGPSPTEFAAKQEGLPLQAWRDQRFAAVTKDLLFMSTSKPLLLFIDDLHWADSASLALLHYISRAISSERVLVLATFRSEELGPNREGFTHPLLDTLKLMGREVLFKEIQLLNLNPPDVGRIAETMLGGKVHEELVQRLGEESRGNALFIVEYLRMLHENGSLTQKDRKWNLATTKFGIPTKVRNIISRRLNALKPSQRRVLDVASVIGEKFDPQLISAVLNLSSLEVFETLNTIALSRSLVCVEGDYYKFDHPKSREILYEELLLPLKKHYHEIVAERIEERNRNAEHQPLSDLAYHYTQAGNKTKSIEYNLTAGKDACARFSNAEAIRNFTYVLQNSSENEKQRAIALEGLGDAFFSSMRFKEATKTFETLANMEGDSKLRALRKAMEASFYQNDIPHLQQLIAKAEKCNVTDRLEKGRILMNKGRVSVMYGQPAESIENYEKALRIFEEEYSLWDTAWVLIALGINLPNVGKLERGLACSYRSVAMFHELKDNRWLIEAYNIAGMACITWFGFWKEGIDMLMKAAEVNEEEKVGDYLRLAQLKTQWAWALWAMGDISGALSKSLEALRYADTTDSDWAKGMAYSNLTMYYTMSGDTKHAEDYFSKLVNLPSPVLLNPTIFASLANALFLAGKNRWEESKRAFEEIFENLRNSPGFGWEAIERKGYAWALSKKGDVEQAEREAQKAQKIYDGMRKRFEHTNVQTSIMAPIHAMANQPFEARMYIINTSRATGRLIKIENIVPTGFRVLTVSPECTLSNGSINQNIIMEPLTVKSIRISLEGVKSGVAKLKPRVMYVDDMGETKTSEPREIEIAVTVPSAGTISEMPEIALGKVRLQSQFSKQVFDFLASAFNEDYVNRKMPREQSGWRTLMDIVKQSKVSKYSVYGFPSGSGQAIVELENAGLIEVRIFVGERGRGGKITKVRVAHQSEHPPTP